MLKTVNMYRCNKTLLFHGIVVDFIKSIFSHFYKFSYICAYFYTEITHCVALAKRFVGSRVSQFRSIKPTDEIYKEFYGAGL